MKTIDIKLMLVILNLALFSLVGCGKSRMTLTTEPTIVPEATSTQVMTVTPTSTSTPKVDQTQPETPASVPSETAIGLTAGKILFDDFSYSDSLAFTGNGWIIREKGGWPGVPGAGWSKENISFLDNPDQAGNFWLQMTSSTNGTASGTLQTQICQQRKFYEGTYATRIRFTDEPTSGPDGDQVVETFYMISPLEAPMDPNYSEMDNEYIPNGGWGNNDHVFYASTWETAQLDPWKADNTFDLFPNSMAGWHTIVMQVIKGNVNYLLDGKLIALHWGKYYPEVPMSINYNLWFVNGGLLNSADTRQYIENIDWVYFVADEQLTPPEIENQVEALRTARVSFQDSVPAWDPPLPSPCDM